jgi:hypothetical protein
MVAEGGACRFDGGGELGLVEGFFGRRSVFLGNDVVDGLFHLLLFFIIGHTKNTTAYRSLQHNARPLCPLLFIGMQL